MMKKECEVARDLMPLVLDDVASDGSKALVLDHIQGCADCTAYFDQLKQDVPAKTPQEIEAEHSAFAQATAKLRRQKRIRTLKHVLLGVVIAVVVLLAGAMGYNRLSHVTRQIGLDEYAIVLSQLGDGRLVVTADYKGSTTYLGTTFHTVRETDEATGETVTVLYVGIERYLFATERATPMQNHATARISPDELASFDEIRQGTPKGSAVLWKAGEPIAAASEEMEAYYGWIEVMDRFEAHMVETGDGKLGFSSEEDASRDMLMHTHWIALQSVVPEWQPWIGLQYEPLAEETLRWVLREGESKAPDLAE